MTVHALWASASPHAVMQKVEAIVATSFNLHSYFLCGFFRSHFFWVVPVILSMSFEVLFVVEGALSESI